MGIIYTSDWAFVRRVNSYQKREVSVVVQKILIMHYSSYLMYQDIFSKYVLAPIINMKNLHNLHFYKLVNRLRKTHGKLLSLSFHFFQLPLLTFVTHFSSVDKDLEARRH
jgi:hypothetical protein